jgi:hypothetical protein
MAARVKIYIIHQLYVRRSLRATVAQQQRECSRVINYLRALGSDQIYMPSGHFIHALRAK